MLVGFWWVGMLAPNISVSFPGILKMVHQVDWWCSCWRWWTTPCPSSHCPPEFFFDRHVGGTILDHSYFLNFFVGPLLHAQKLLVGGVGGGPQDYWVSPSPLLAPFGPIRVGTGLDWVWIGSGGIGDSGVGDLGLTIVLKLKLRLLSVYIWYPDLYYKRIIIIYHSVL